MLSVSVKKPTTKVHRNERSTEPERAVHRNVRSTEPERAVHTNETSTEPEQQTGAADWINRLESQK